MEIKASSVFTDWLGGLRDRAGRAKIIQRIDRLAAGNAGDIKPVGDGVSELRIHAGPGYRVYLMQRGGMLIVLLAGGDKSSQSRDIRRAKEVAEAWRD